MFFKNRNFNSMFVYVFLFAATFLIGGFFISNVVFADTSGPNNATSAINEGGGTSWTLNSPFTVDSTSSASVSLGVNNSSKNLKFTGYNFSIPDGSTIDGITVNITRKATSNIKDSVVELITSDITTDSKADTSTPWPSTFISKSYGESTDTWGKTWTTAEINDPSFGFIISAKNFDISSSRTAHIDGVTIIVTYTIPVTTHTLTYTTGANGTITGTNSQTVDQGSNGSLVTAVANDGYHFTSWSDGIPTAERTDLNVQEEISVTASFAINLSSDKDITSFNFPDLGSGVITGTDIAVTVPFGTDVTAITPMILFSGASINPLSGVVENFTNPIIYTVTAADNSTKNYSITVKTEVEDEVVEDTPEEEDVVVDDPIIPEVLVTKSHNKVIGSYISKTLAVSNTKVIPQVLGADKYNFTKFIKFEKVGVYNLKIQGDEVTELQKLLNSKGFDCGLVDGKFGPLTKAGVIAFQLANGLNGDGIVGALTRAVLNK